MKFFIRLGHGPRTNRLHFGGDPVLEPDPVFLNPDHDPDLYCPERLISVSVEDFSSSQNTHYTSFLDPEGGSQKVTLVVVPVVVGISCLRVQKSLRLS